MMSKRPIVASGFSRTGTKIWTGIAMLLAVSAVLIAQQTLDRVIVRFGSEIVTELDVRQARMLKLLPKAGQSDRAMVEALVNRKLILAELRRSGVAEPSADAIDARERDWRARLGAGASPSDLLAQAGMSEAGIRGWFRDDLRIEAYLTERFGDRQADVDNWIAALRQRAGVK